MPNANADVHGERTPRPLPLKLLLVLLLNLLVKDIHIRSAQTGPTTTPAAKRRHKTAPDVSPG